MQIVRFALLGCVLLPLSLSAETGSDQPPDEVEHPAEVALQELPDGEFRYVHARTSLRLYVYEKDEPGKSNCVEGCASARPPLLASEDARQSVGDWALLEREDGSTQWTYKGQPVYLFFHDSANDPRGYEPSEGWHFLEP